MGNSKARTCLPGLGPACWGWDSWEMRLSPVTGALRGGGAETEIGTKRERGRKRDSSKDRGRNENQSNQCAGFASTQPPEIRSGSSLSLRAPSCPELRVVQQWDFSWGSAACPVSHRLLRTPANTVPLARDVGRCTCLRTKRS